MKQFFCKSRNVLIALSFVLLLSSCGYKDIDKRAFVVTIGIDKAESEDKKYNVMLKTAIPTPDPKAGEQKFIIAKEESNSITGAVRLIKSKVPKEIDFSHAKMILFGESLMEEDVQEVLDWFIRRRDIQKIAWVGIGRPNAADILKIKRKTEVLPSESLFLSFGNTGTDSAYIISEYLFDFRKRLTEKGLDPILPILEARKDYFEINKAALFDKEKLKLVLTVEETKILNIIMNRVEKADVKVKREDDPGKESYFISLESAKTNYKIKSEKNKKPTIDMNIKIAGVIEETFEEIERDKLNKYKPIAEKQFEQKVTKFLKKIQTEKLDPIGFGLAYRAYHFNKDDWEKWESMYSDVDFHVNVDLKFVGTGLLK